MPGIKKFYLTYDIRQRLTYLWGVLRANRLWSIQSACRWWRTFHLLDRWCLLVVAVDRMSWHCHHLRSSLCNLRNTPTIVSKWHFRLFWIYKRTRQSLVSYSFFYRQLGCLAFSLWFWPKIKQLVSNCPASDWTFSFKTGDFCIIV